MKHLLLIGFLVSFSLLGNSQKFGKVDKSEFGRSFHPLAPESHAAYIFHNGAAYIGYKDNGYPFLYIRRHDRIQIFDEEGKDYVESYVELYNSKRESEKISSIKVTTSNLVRGKVKKSKLSKKEINKERVAENWTVVSFGAPELKVGSIVDIYYTIESPFISYIPIWNFQMDIPIDKSSYTVQFPYDLPYVVNTNGLIKLDLKTKSGQSSYTGYDEYIYKAENVIPAVSDELVLNMADYISGVSFSLEPEYFNSPIFGGKNSWDKLSSRLLKAKFIDDALHNNYKSFAPIIDSLENVTDDEKIKSAYEYIQKTYTWNRTFDIGSLDGPSEVVKTHTGSIGDINLLLLNLLKSLKINASPIITKCRNHGLINVSSTSLSDFNYLVAQVNHPDGRTMLLDATSKFVPFGQLPLRALNAAALPLVTENARLVSFNSPNKYQFNSVSNYDVSLASESPKLIGIGKKKYDDYAATRYRIELNAKEQEEGVSNELILHESWGDKDLYEPTKLDFDENDLTSIVVEFSQELSSVLETKGDSLLVNAALNFGIIENPFTEPTRPYPIFYNHLTDLNYVASIDIPKGYKLLQFPETKLLSLPDQDGRFNYEVKAEDRKLTIYYQLEINKDIFLPEHYPALKEFYQLIVDTQNEKIVFINN